MAVLTKHFSIRAANLAVLDITTNTSPKYVFVGHPSPWFDDTNTWNDNFVPVANISIEQSETNTYNEIVFGKLIQHTDVTQMILRHNWVPGTVYTRYSGQDPNLYSGNFYVVTDNRDVYKVIDNNYGTPSTVKPTVTSAKGTFFTSDGYVWKYMYTIPSDVDAKFSTTNYIPVVPNLSVVANAIPGTIDTIDITSFGTNYKAFYTGFLENAVNGYVMVLDNNAAPYSNFYVGSSMYLKSGFGSGQLRGIVAYDGLNKLVRLNEPFDIFATFSLVDINGTFNVGDTLTQNLDSLAIVYYKGVFQVGDSIVQSDTGAGGIITAANSVVLQVVRNTANLFSLNYPIYDTVTSGTQAGGTVTVQPFSDLFTHSNTAAFINGEIIFQNNGSANVGTGVLFSTQNMPSANVSFEPIVSVVQGDNFIRISGNPYSRLDEILYKVDTGNTAVFPLSNNGVYYVSYANDTGIALSSASGGANLTLTLSRSETFNPNTGLNGNSFISIPGNWIVNGNPVIYTVSPGNTIPVGLSNGSTYYAVYANALGTNLSLVPGGPNVAITNSSHSEVGHTLTFSIPPEIGHHLSYTQQKLIVSQISGVFTNSYQVKGFTSSANAVLATAQTDANGLGYVYSTNTSQTAFTTTFPANSYIRVGTNVNTNIRRVVSSNSICIVVDYPIAQSAVANLNYVVPNALEIASYTLLTANALIANTDLDTVIVNYSNVTQFGTNFIAGERIDLIDSGGIYQGTHGIVSYSNTSSVVIAQISGPGFVSGFYLSGESSLQYAYITNIADYPTVTVRDSLGKFIIGQEVYSRSTANLMINGSGNIVSYFITPSQLTEYIISPTVTITGDGEGALAYSTVNTSPTVNLPLANVIVINSGIGYTYANVVITSNVTYGSGASALAAISPLLGHGYDPHEELGASYVGVSVGIANATLESYYFPMFGNYRKVGILDTPFYNELYLDIKYFDRAQLSINHISNTYFPGEVVYQPNSSAAGIVVYGNSSYLELKNVIGTFSANGTFANGQPANDNVVGLYSNAVGNVSAKTSAQFDVLSDNQLVYEDNNKTHAVLVSITNQSNLQLTNVSGLFVAGDMLYDPTINAYGYVNSMYTVNGTINVTNSFGLRFNQTLRIPLTVNTISYQLYESVTQTISNASGIVVGGKVSVPGQLQTPVNIGNDVDLTYSGAAGSFPIGSIVYNAGNVGVGTVVSSNTSYLRLSAVNGHFTNGDSLTSTIQATATVGSVFPVMILNNVDGEWDSGVLSGNIVGSNTGAVGRCDLSNVIQHPDLVRNSGHVMYLENLAPFSLSNTAQEQISLIMAF